MISGYITPVFLVLMFCMLNYYVFYKIERFYNVHGSFQEKILKNIF